MQVPEGETKDRNNFFCCLRLLIRFLGNVGDAGGSGTKFHRIAPVESRKIEGEVDITCICIELDQNSLIKSEVLLNCIGGVSLTSQTTFLKFL